WRCPVADGRTGEIAEEIAEEITGGTTEGITGAIRVLLVDDHQVVRRGLRTFLEVQDDIEVVGEAADGAEGVARAEELRPDVVLMDVKMPGTGGIEALRTLREARNPARVLV